MGDDDIIWTTAPRDRSDGVDPTVPEDFERLRDLPPERLESLGCRPWEDELWLFPVEWYSHIPDGFEVETANGKVIEFEPGVTNPNPRFGVLPYGIRIED